MTEYLICRSCDCASLQKMSIAHVFSLRVLHWYKSPACLMRLLTYLSSAGGTRTDLILAGRDMLQFLLVATWGQSFVTSLMPLLTKYLLFPSTSIQAIWICTLRHVLRRKNIPTVWICWGYENLLWGEISNISKSIFRLKLKQWLLMDLQTSV